MFGTGIPNRAIQLVGALFMLFSACTSDKGQADRMPPKTRLTIPAINIGTPENPERIPSRFRLNWSGTSASGYIVGYRIAWRLNEDFDATTYFTQNPAITTIKTDSTFTFSIPAGTPNPTVYFYVQAVDNLGLSDPQPAKLVIPIINRLPQATFVGSGMPTFPIQQSVITLAVEATDPDGNQTIDSFLIRANGGAWVNIPANSTILTLVPTQPLATGATSFKILSGFGATDTRKTITLIQSDKTSLQPNVFELKAVDQTGGASSISTSEPFTILRRSADLLVVDSDTLSGMQATSLYTQILNRVYSSGYDYIDMMRSFNGRKGASQPRYWSLTFGELAKLYPKMFWYSDAGRDFNMAEPNISLMIETASEAMREYVAGGGRLLVSASFPTAASGATIRLDSLSPILTWLPIDGRASKWTTGRVAATADVKVTTADSSNFPALTFTRAYTSVTPFAPTTDVNTRPLYFSSTITRADFQPWRDPRHFAARRVNAQGNTNLVFFSIELWRLNGNTTNLDQTFDRILNREFN